MLILEIRKTFNRKLRAFVWAEVALGLYITFQLAFNDLAFYGSQFFALGSVVTKYNIFRAIFILIFAWLIYAPGFGLLILLNSKKEILSLKAGGRHAIGFYACAGIWAALLLIVGLAGGYNLKRQ